MVSQKQFKEHYLNLYKNKAVYVWGANGETITKALTDRLYKAYGSSTYNKTYYDNKAKEGQGRIGADCSGSIYPLSKADNTAKGYYRTCKSVGSINDLPADTACLLFNSNFTHVGAYMGDGTTIEMMSSTKNCVKQKLQKSRWTYYGIPAWLETAKDNTIPTVSTGSVKSKVIANIQSWCNEYCGAGLTVDGEYGPKTKQGLCKALQRCLNVEFNAGLTVDGVFGQKTKAECRKASATDELCYICQAMLFCKGYNMNHSIKNNNLDKSYGTGTKKAVLEFQQSTRGLRQDGICGPATFYAMFNS